MEAKLVGKFILVGGVAASFNLLPVNVQAGLTSPLTTTSVRIVDAGMNEIKVTGKPGVTRYTNNAVEYISCGGSSYSENNGTLSGCFARDVDGNEAACDSSNYAPNVSELIRAISMVNETSYISFRIDDSGLCKNIKVINSSTNLGVDE